MGEENIIDKPIVEPSPVTSVSEGGKTRAPKGKAIPTLRYSEVIAVLNSMAARAVESGDKSTLSVILDNTPTSSVFNNKVSCLKAYGVITIDEKENTWALTDLGKRIANPTSNDDQLLAEQMAFAQYPLLSTIWAYYKGKLLTEEHVPNAVAAYCGVPAFLKNEWAQYFIEAVRTVKLTFVVSGQERVAESFSRSGTRAEAPEVKKEQEKLIKPIIGLPPSEKPAEAIEGFGKTSYKRNEAFPQGRRCVSVILCRRNAFKRRRERARTRIDCSEGDSRSLSSEELNKKHHEPCATTKNRTEDRGRT